MSQNKSKPNRQIQRTKSWIFDAIILLMDKKPYDKITVSDIIEKAGIARQTFYRNYGNKGDVIFEYLRNSFNSDLLKIENETKQDKQDHIVFTFNYGYMINHRKNIKKIVSIADIKNRIIHELQEFPISLTDHYKDTLSSEDYLICRYKICYQITGTLNIFFDWFINDMPLPAEKFISMLNAMNIPNTVQYRNIPNIIVRLKNE
jgi:AcrR family transcriptional regulator